MRNEQVQRVVADSRALWDEGRRDAAVAVLRDATEAWPDEPDLWIELALDAWEDDPVEAVDAVRRAGELARSDPDTLTRCAWVMLHLERYRESREYLLSIREADLGKFTLVVQAAHIAGRLAVQRGRPEQAEELFRLALQGDPANASAAQSLITLLLDQGRLDDASEALTAALSQCGSEQGLLRLRVDVLVRQIAGGRPREPEDAVRSQAPELQAVLERADSLYFDGAAEANLDLLTQALRDFPDEVEVVTRAAVAHRNLGDPDTARVLARQAVALGPRDPWNLANAAGVLILVGDLDAARAATRDAAIHAPVGWERAADVVELAGRIAARRGDAEEAEEHLTAVLAAAPDTGSAALQLAELYVDTDRVAEAIDVLRAAIAAGAEGDELELRLRQLE